MNIDDRLLSCRRYLASAPELWKADLLTPTTLWQFTTARSVAIFNPETIERLWQIGLLRADLITSEAAIVSPSLQHIGANQDIHTYFDLRKPRRKIRGYGGAFPRRSLRRDIRIYFHPFRFYVLYHVARVFSMGISSTQYLKYPLGHLNVWVRRIELLDDWTSKPAFCDLFDKWNRTAEAAIICEPMSYTEVFRKDHWQFPSARTSFSEQFDDYRRRLIEFIMNSDIDCLEEFRHDLCWNADRLDENPIIHVLIRLTTWHARRTLKSALGGSMLLLTMAEIMRRAMEAALGREFPEEDEVGQQWMPGARKLLYGAERVLNAPQTSLRSFLAEAGIDYGTKVRCYLEGSTEIGALKSAIEHLGGIELINLRGQFAAKGAKGIAFRESLEADIKASVFSFILMDTDNKEYARVVKKAAEDDLICGRFFLASPDFEMANFSTPELCTIVAELAKQTGIEPPPAAELERKVAGVSSVAHFFEVVRAYPQLGGITKGEAWGEALMKYAMQKPYRGNGTERSVIEAAKWIIRAKDLKYAISRHRFRIDAASGQLVERTGTGAARE